MESVKAFNEDYVKKIEQQGKRIFNLVKMGEDNYLIPEHVLNTYSIIEKGNDKFNETELWNNEELINEIKSLMVEDKAAISVRRKRTLENGINVIEIMNLSKCFEKVLEINLPGEFDYNQRQALGHLLRDIFKDKKSVQILVYSDYTLTTLKTLINERINDI